MSSELKPCFGCGMEVTVDEYHPHAACILYKSRTGEAVSEALAQMKEHFLSEATPGMVLAPEEPTEEMLGEIYNLKCSIAGEQLGEEIYLAGQHEYRAALKVRPRKE